jgi:hypothetical protein
LVTENIADLRGRDRGVDGGAFALPSMRELGVAKRHAEHGVGSLHGEASGARDPPPITGDKAKVPTLPVEFLESPGGNRIPVEPFGGWLNANAGQIE